MSRVRVSVPLGWLLVGILGLVVEAADQPVATIDFAREIYPVLRRACFECHGPKKQEGDLRLDRREAALEWAIVPGNADESELYRRITLPKGHDEIMPALGEPLTKAQTDRIRDWINLGASWPEQVETAKHWAYVKPVRPPLPAVRNTAWPRNEIDYFILSRLEAEGLQPSPEADRATLIRRVSLDLTGLPPTPEAVDAFVRDPDPQAYEKLVDRLLASPQFGERWARPWLDLARYADSHGFQRDDLREMWAYRDWVIDALNADMPFDQFTIEQLAGDLLPNATESQKIATGFHRGTTTNVEAGSEPEETRINQVIDRVNTTAAVWLGTTLECAQCHDHKYDPFTQRDYYRLLAFFNNTEIEADRSNPKVPGSIKFLGPSMPLEDPTQTAERERLEQEFKELDQRIAARRKQLAGDLDEWARQLVSAAEAAAQLHPLDVSDFVSEGGATHRILDDKSVLLGDDPPDKDTYVVTVRTKLTGITGFKLEALTDPSLPGSGPGRGDAKRPNFVLNTLSVTASPCEKGSGTGDSPVRLVNARASFSQARYNVAGAIDDDPKTAWAINPRFHESHWATFETAEPLGCEDGLVLTFTLVQEYGGGRAIGRLRLSAMTGDPQARSVPAEVIKILKTPNEQRTAAQTKKLLDFRLEQDEQAARWQQQRTRVERDLKALQPPTTLVMRELDQPRMTTIFQRGNYLEPGEPVQPGTPDVLHPFRSDGTPNRLDLARWLVDPDNPLTARVTVNRWWGELFGHGLVSTVEDFGLKGEPPTHPELLDWLAVEFVDGKVGRERRVESGEPEKSSRNSGTSRSGSPRSALSAPVPQLSTFNSQPWSRKYILRLIVTSATYRQSSKITPELWARDDQNRLYARGPRFRMSAEMIRDNALAAAGLLSLKQGGPPIRPYQPDGLWNKVGGAKVEYVVSPGEDRYRRGVYVVWKRSAPYPSFVNFDATARLACTVKRSRSNTPLQALTLLNDPVYVEAAKALARRTLLECHTADVQERLRYAFRLCLSREPTAAELQTLQRLHDRERQAFENREAAAKALIGEFPLPPDTTPTEFAAWYSVGTVLLNLDETITKS